jgi:transcription elongation factor GreA
VKKISYKIVGKDEADLKQKLIYFQSPIGKGLIGKKQKKILLKLIHPQEQKILKL